jgi:hypothetical protein
MKSVATILALAEAGRSTKSAMENDIQLGIYEHYKKKRYEVIGVAQDSDTLEEFVVYRALYNSEEFGDHALWIRPKAEFLEDVEIDGKRVPRFQYISGETEMI